MGFGKLHGPIKLYPLDVHGKRGMHGSGVPFDIDVLSDGGVVGFGRKKSNGLHLC